MAKFVTPAASDRLRRAVVEFTRNSRRPTTDAARLLECDRATVKRLLRGDGIRGCKYAYVRKFEKKTGKKLHTESPAARSPLIATPKLLPVWDVSASAAVQRVGALRSACTIANYAESFCGVVADVAMHSHIDGGVSHVDVQLRSIMGRQTLIRLRDVDGRIMLECSDASNCVYFGQPTVKALRVVLHHYYIKTRKSDEREAHDRSPDDGRYASNDLRGQSDASR